MINSKKTFSSFVWRFLERTGAQGVTFVVSIILARLLEPQIYGTVALVTVFTGILDVFVNHGIGNALIQKKDADDLDFSSVFYFNIILSLVLYLFMFSIAPYIARFYNNSGLTSIIRVMSLSVIVSSIKNVQQAYVSKNLMFKKFFFSTLGGTIGAAFIGIFMAYKGFGVWALVSQRLFNEIVDTIILWGTVKWRPKKAFSLERLHTLLTYGWKLLVSALLDTGYAELRSLIIGKKYSAADLAYYNKANTFPSVIVSNINSSIDSVLLPTMSAEQDNIVRVKNMTRRAIKTSTFFIMPLMVGLAVCAKSIVRILLTDKWLPIVPYMRVFCFTYSLFPIHTANLNAIKAVGRSDLFLKLEIIKKIIGLIAIGTTMWFGVIWMAYSMIIVSVLSQIVNAYPNKRLLDYSYWDQIIDIFPHALMSGIMGILVYGIQFLSFNVLWTLVIQVSVGILVYLLEIIILKPETYIYIRNLLRNFQNRKNSV